MAEENKETPMLDPIAYRSDYRPEDIQEEYRNDPNLPWVWPLKANENFNEYWDDSNPSWQWYRGWLNPKYEWEWVANSIIDYNPNITTSDLDPNYLFWRAVQETKNKEDNYLAKRNDNIASALYNEWKITKEDVANYLMQQPWFTNSTEADRLNTIESVWKRLWQIQPKEETKEEQEVPEMDIAEDTAGMLYWKTTAQEWDATEWIWTLVDANSVFKSMETWRIANYNSINSMDSEKVAVLISDWLSPFSEQTMRDLQQWNPAKYKEIQDNVKKIKWQDIVNQISEGWSVNVTSQLDASVSNVNTSMNNFVNSTASGSGAWTLATNLNNALAQSETVSTARWQMEEYKKKIADIQQSIDELPSLANQYFKWDVPQYLVNAFISNRTQKYQKEIEKYQNLYNATLDEAKLEISQQQWREEMNYKRSSLQSDQNYKNANLELSRQELEFNRQKAAISQWQWNDDWSYSYVDLDWVLHTLSAEEAKKALNQDLYNKSTAYIDYWKKAIDNAKASWLELYWEQCEAMTDNYARQSFWTEMKKEDWSKWATTVEEKARYATEALPQRWYIAVFDFWIKQANWVNYWHTGIVIDYDPVTWDFTTLESNAKKDKNWNPIVTIQTRNINSSNLIWFWDPTVSEPRNWNWTSTPTWSYYDYPNGMYQVFSEASAFAKKRWWVDMVDNVQKASRAYWMLNNMNKNWEIEALISDPEIATAFQEFSNFINSQRFLQNAYTNNLTDEDHNFFIDTVLQYMMNSWQLWITSEKKQALDDLVWLVQIKLRWDSWAAINPSEWNTDFGRYLPQIWMSPRENLQRIRNLEVDASSSLLPIEYQAKYSPIISDEMIAAASDKILSVKDKAKEAAKNLKNKK